MTRVIHSPLTPVTHIMANSARSAMPAFNSFDQLAQGTPDPGGFPWAEFSAPKASFQASNCSSVVVVTHLTSACVA